MGGGRRGGGMGGGPGMGGARRSPAAMLKENLEANDPIAFLLDRKKALLLTDLQKDSLKTYRKEMQRMQEPLFKDVEKQFTDIAAQGGAGRGGEMGSGGSGRRGGGMGGGGMGGGGMGGGGMGGGSRGGGDDAGGMGRGMGAMPDTVKSLITRLNDIQDAYRDRARTQLNESQRHSADSMMTIMLEEQRKKADDERARRRG